MAPDVAVAFHIGRKQPFAIIGLKGLVTNHALGHESGKRLIKVQIPDISKGAHEKAGIQQMQHRMFDTANVLVNRHPVRRSFTAEAVRVVRVSKS